MMNDLDFSKSATLAAAPIKTSSSNAVAAYDPNLALVFFKLAGTQESFAAGSKVFAEGDKPGIFSKGGHRFYLLLEGEITLTRNGKPLNLVMPGEIFGEMAVIAAAPRSATATARKSCRTLSLDAKGFLASLKQGPEFAFMLISVMAQRLRQSVERLLGTKPQALALRQGNGLPESLLADLRRAMGDPIPVRMAAGDAIVTQGAVGVSMFVLIEGQVTIAIEGRVIESVGPGETFGETAMLGPSVRAATATADSDGAWLPITRDVFLEMVRLKPEIGIALLRSMSQRLNHIGSLIGEG